MASQASHTVIGFYDGPINVDFFYQEAEPHADPWLRDGFVALVDPDGSPMRYQPGSQTSAARRT